MVSAIGGNVRLSPRSDCNPINPGDEVLFVLDDNLAVLLVELQRGDVKNEDISIQFVTPYGVGWTGAMDDIPGAVREVAESVLSSMEPS